MRYGPLTSRGRNDLDPSPPPALLHRAAQGRVAGERRLEDLAFEPLTEVDKVDLEVRETQSEILNDPATFPTLGLREARVSEVISEIKRREM